MSYTSAIFAARQVQQDDNDGIPFNTQLAYGQKGKNSLSIAPAYFIPVVTLRK